ncbi:hypothetical protein HPB51_019471 [Rhipicephalus microplus]|uniref:GMP reductase n=1 Tax=Rhipicephalus microplus TaxID=6941 RepID=A0A9J6DBV7_RHIMP|nr:hypothetical protein HPB51_019471 [Rhipicephalus microplus]
MPHIDNDVKLDFKDVLLRPKRSTLKSRVEVDLNRTFKFRNSKATYTGIPIIAANMDTVGTFEMAQVLAKAGNVVTGEMVEELLLSGADIIKVGIGPGSVCTTRKKTGVGYPQLSAVIECSDAAHGLDGHIISDGGCTCPGDVSKAFGAGADFVMLGGMLAGHDESGGEVIEKDGKKYKMFYGMSSATAMEKYHGVRAANGPWHRLHCDADSGENDDSEYAVEQPACALSSLEAQWLIQSLQFLVFTNDLLPTY